MAHHTLSWRHSTTQSVTRTKLCEKNQPIWSHFTSVVGCLCENILDLVLQRLWYFWMEQSFRSLSGVL